MPGRARRTPLMERLPGGLLRVPAPGHREAIDGSLLLPLLIGRLKDPQSGKLRTYREADRLAEAFSEEIADPRRLDQRLRDYGAFVIATAPTSAQRLRGVTVTAFLEHDR